MNPVSGGITRILEHRNLLTGRHENMEESMKRKIKLHTGAYTEVDDTKKKVMTQKEWMEEGKKRFGEDFMNWKFQCPMCCHVASIKDFKDAGAKDPNCAYQECIGRYQGKGAPVKGDSSGCNWAAYGLFGIPNGKGITVISDDGIGTECFDFAE